MSKGLAAWMITLMFRVALSVTVGWIMVERIQGYFALFRSHFRSLLP
jgi:hypothetical protein